MAIFCARSTFLTVCGKNAPALTVASLATTMTGRPLTRPMPVMHAGGGDVAPIGIHLPRRPKAQLQPFCAGIEELVQTFPRRQPSQLLLPLSPSLITSLADRRFLGLEGGELLPEAISCSPSGRCVESWQ